jgi:nitronate monooxygenase
MGGVVYHDATKREWAQKALDAGVDGLIAVNQRADGHLGEYSKEVLFDELGSLGLPIVCAGGIGNAMQYREAMQLGYAGCQLGTRFIATTECSANDAYKQAIIAANEAHIVASERITGVPVSVINNDYIKRQGLTAGKFSHWLLNDSKRKHWVRLFYTLRSAFRLRDAMQDKSGKKDFWQAGKSVATITTIETAGDIVNDFSQAL